MKKLIKHLAVTVISSLALLSLCLTGCKSYVNDKPADEIDVAYITVSDSARTASVVKPAEIDYTVTAHKTDKNGTKLTGSDAKSVSEYTPFEGVNLTYKLALESGWWIFEVYGYTHDESITDPKARANPILYGNTTKPVQCNGGRYYETIRVDFTKQGNGKVKLEIDVSAVTINKLKISETGIALDGEYSAANGKIIINKENLKSGTYTAKMDFYTGTALLYSAKETINITDNLEVTNWIYSGGNDYLVRIDAEDSIYAARFVLTPDLITKNKNNYCYVGTVNDVALKSLKTPSDSNAGTVIAPYATLQAAFDRTAALNKEFKNAGKQQRSFTIYIADNINTSTSTEASITNDDGSTYNLSIVKYGATESLPVLTGNISIGQNVSTTITSLSMDGLKSSSKLTLNNCKLSGSSAFEITNVSEESVLTNVEVGSTERTNAITFTNSNVKIVNTKNYSLFATDFTADNTLLNISCSSNSASDRVPVKADNFIIKDSNGTAGKEITLSSTSINANTNFTLENSSYVKLSNITLTGPQFNTSSLSNALITDSSSITATSGSNLNNSQIDFTNSRLTGLVHINGDTASTGNKKKISFSGSGTILSGNGITVSNASVEFKSSSSITSTGSISFSNSEVDFNTAASISNTNTPVIIENCETTIDGTSINVKSIKTGNAATQGSEKTDTVSIANSSTITTDEGITFNSSDVNISESTIRGAVFVSKDDFVFHNSTLYGDIGKADTSETGTGSAADGIDTASNVILSGTSTLTAYTAGDKKYSGTVYVEDTAILYTTGLPAKEDSPDTIALISALYPTKGEVILVNLDEDGNEIDYDNSFIVDEVTGSNPIDERFKLSSAGYYLDYAKVPAGTGIRKGVIKESSISLILPQTGGFTIEITENSNVKVNPQGHIVLKIANLAASPVKAVIKDSDGNVVNAAITYRLFREATQIGNDVTGAASSQGITISGAKLEQELQYADKVTYLLQIKFKDEESDVLYADIFFVDILKE